MVLPARTMRCSLVIPAVDTENLWWDLRERTERKSLTRASSRQILHSPHNGNPE